MRINDIKYATQIWAIVNKKSCRDTKTRWKRQTLWPVSVVRLSRLFSQEPFTSPLKYVTRNTFKKKKIRLATAESQTQSRPVSRSHSKTKRLKTRLVESSKNKNETKYVRAYKIQDMMCRKTLTDVHRTCVRKMKLTYKEDIECTGYRTIPLDMSKQTRTLDAS